MTITLAILLSSFMVKASEPNPILELDSSSGLDELCTNVNTLSQEYAAFDFITKGTTTSGKATLTLDIHTYFEELSTDERKEVMETALTTVNSSNNISSRAKTRIYNFIANQDEVVTSMVKQLSTDVNADFATAYSWFKPFTGGISTILGFMCFAIFIFLAFTIVVDLAFLAIPAVTVFCTKENGERRFVSKEAAFAMAEAEREPNSGKSYFSIYARKKILQFAVLAICLLYLVTGKIYLLISWFIDAYQGFLI